MGEMIYYFNGTFVPASRAALPMNDLGIVRGYGVFDYLRTYDRTPFRLYDHIKRLESSAQQIGIALPWRTDELEELVHATLAQNALAQNDVSDVGIRIVVTGGPSDNYMTPQNQPSLVIMVQPIAPMPAQYFAQGGKAITTRIARIMPTVKSLNYIGAIMAVSDASKAGAVEAIYLDDQEQLTEGTRANLFVFQGNRLITPGEGILKGITRQVVLEVAADEFEVVESPIYHRDLKVVDEVILTSTTKEILPIVQVDDLQIGNGKPGPRTQRLMELFAAYVQQVGAPVAA